MDKMILPEEYLPPDDSPSSQENSSTSPALPEGFTPLGNAATLTRARRRRAGRKLVLPSTNERADVLERLAQRAFPSIEFFLFAVLSGAILGLAYLLNAPALLLLGILLAPLLTPWVGMTLALVTGSWRFFFLTLLGLLVAGGLVFLGGVLAGFAGRLWEQLPFFYARIFAILWWPYYLADLFIVILGAVILAYSFVHSEQKPSLASNLLAYGLFLPISAAGIGLGLGREVNGDLLWPNGVLVALLHLAIATLAGGLVLAGMRFKPVKRSGYLLPVLLVLLAVLALVFSSGWVDGLRQGITNTRSHVPTTPASLPPTLSATSLPATQTSEPTGTASLTPSLPPTAQPTPAYAIISTDAAFGGANLRESPGGALVLVLPNGLQVEVLPDTANVGTVSWRHVRTPDGLEGWVLESVLSLPASTPGITGTPTP